LKTLSFIIISFLSFQILASTNGLTINATEVGVAKFHRFDNNVHEYGINNAWSPSILPANISPEQTPIVLKIQTNHSA